MLIALTTFAFIAALIYLVAERRNRARWVRYERVGGYGGAAPTPFRAAKQQATYFAPVAGSRAPWRVRAVAQWSIVLGLLGIPGAAFAMFGSIFYGLGLVGVPGVILAFRIWSDGHRLLAADPRVIDSAPQTGTFAYILNACVIAATGIMVLGEAYGLAAFTGIYALISIAHAACLQAVAQDVKRHLDERHEALSLDRRPGRKLYAVAA